MAATLSAGIVSWQTESGIFHRPRSRGRYGAAGGFRGVHGCKASGKNLFKSRTEKLRDRNDGLQILKSWESTLLHLLHVGPCCPLVVGYGANCPGLTRQTKLRQTYFWECLTFEAGQNGEVKRRSRASAAAAFCARLAPPR